MSISRLHDSVSHQYSSHMPVVKFGSNIWLEETLCLDFSMCVLLVCGCVCGRSRSARGSKRRTEITELAN